MGGSFPHVDQRNRPASDHRPARARAGRIACARQMTDAHALLARHSPRLVYDSQEAYFADSAAIWNDSAFNVLKRANGTLLAKPPQLALGYLGAHTYADGKPVLADDAIGETTKDYAKH